MTLITFGKKTKRKFFAFFSALDQWELARNIGLALGRIYRDLFIPNAHSHYPSPYHRALLIKAGMLSFFIRLFGFLPEDWTMRFLLEVIRGSRIADEGPTQHALEGHEEIMSEIFSMHRELQQREPLMNIGAKIPYGIFLFSNFQQSESERAAHRERIKAMVESFQIYQAPQS